SRRSFLHMGHSLLGGIPASRRSFLHMGHSLLGGIPASRRSFLHMGHSLLGGIPASRRSFLHMGHSLLGGIPASRRSFLRATRLAALASSPRAPELPASNSLALVAAEQRESLVRSSRTRSVDCG